MVLISVAVISIIVRYEMAVRLLIDTTISESIDQKVHATAVMKASPSPLPIFDITILLPPRMI